MNFSDYWQENKRFVTVVGAGVLLFFVGYLMLDSSLGSKDKKVRAQMRKHQADLKAPMYTAIDRDDAEVDHTALASALEQLADGVVFEPRPEFVLSAGASPSSFYFARVDEVRESLRQLASRSRARLPEGLDIEPLMTNDAETIVRHLYALDLIDRIVRHALDSGVQSIDRIQVKLDPGFQSKEGLGAVERTQVSVEMTGDPKASAACVVATQGSRFGKPIVIDALEARTDRRNADSVLLSLTCSAIALHETRSEEDLD